MDAALLQRGMRAYPTVVVPAAAFAAHLARHAVAGDGFVEDLYLACACSLGNATALAIFERDFLAKTVPFIARVHHAPDFVAEVLQTLRIRLMLPREMRPPGLADYAGRAPLGGWLRVVAVRAARTLLKQNAKYVTYATDAGGAVTAGPERAFMKGEGAEELERAIARTLAKLDDRSRTMLRLYFVEGMSLANLGKIYHVHESTMARRIASLREQLLGELKSELDADSAALHSRLALVASQLGMHLADHLKGSG